jgi:RNA polymerase sigma factor (sigma-70 family)
VPSADQKPSLVERLFAEHSGALHAFFRRRIRSKSEAADLAQEVYLRLLRVSDQEAIRDPIPYLYAVANNLVKEHAVLERRRGHSIDIDSVISHQQLALPTSVEGDVDTARHTLRLRTVLHQLPPKCQAAVLLRFAHGLSYSEVALRLGVSPQMARKYVLQALGHCRRRMGGLNP